MNICRQLIHKVVIAFLILAVLTVGAGYFGKQLPGSFLPDEDQGYLYAGLQLPNASSLQLTSEAAREVEKVMMDTPGVQYVSTVNGYSLLSGVAATYSGFFFISLKPWDERKTPEESYEGIKAHLQQALSRFPGGLAFSFPPPAIPGVGTSGGATFILEDRSAAPLTFSETDRCIWRNANVRTGRALPTALFGVPWSVSGQRQADPSQIPAGDLCHWCCRRSWAAR